MQFGTVICCHTAEGGGLASTVWWGEELEAASPQGLGGTGARLRVRPGLAEPAFLLLLLLRQARHGDSNSQDLRVASDFAFCIGRLRRRTGSQSGETASPEGTMVRLHPSLVRYYRQVTDKFRCRGLLGEAVANGNIPEIAIDADQ